MMKIIKPIPEKELGLSSVQFTSLNSIVFKNVKSVYEGTEKIILEYEHSTKIESSSRDWIGIFPRGWSSFQQYITFEWVSQSFSLANAKQNKENADIVRRAVIFSPKYHIGTVNNNSLYQFVYISKQIEVLGVSSYFRFDLTHSNSRTLELKCLVPVSNKLRSTSVSDFGILLGNNMPSSTSIDTRTLQTSSIHSLQNLDGENKNWEKAHISLNGEDVKKVANFPRKTTGTGDALDPYTSHSEPVFPMSFQMPHCKKCVHFKRGGECLRSQQVLQSKVGPRSEGTLEYGSHRRTLDQRLSENELKIVMERNKVLEKRSEEMKKEMERLQAESKKLKMSFYNANKEKVAYEKFVKDFIKSLEKDSIVRVVNGNTEILVKKVNYVGMEEHPRGKKTSKRERELKAVIGLQEITIRNLINSLQEKAKSAKELNQTVRLAQAFSSARGDTKDYESDGEEILEEVSHSDVTSEYQFSLTKPPPPEEATVVEDTDAVLEDIRRTTEMELKDIGITRSLGKTPSRDSQLDFPNLTVRSYHKETEGTRPKKPRLFDNLEDCWPFSENTPKTIHRRVLETSPRPQTDQRMNQLAPGLVTGEKIAPEEVGEEVVGGQEVQFENPGGQSEGRRGHAEDPATYEAYFDAYEESEEGSVENTTEEPEGMTISRDETVPSNEEKKNFLVTAIIPQEMSIKPVKQEEDWTMAVKDEVEDQRAEPPAKREKKFTCQLSIDFSSSARNQPNIENNLAVVTARPEGNAEDNQPDQLENKICNQFNQTPFEEESDQSKPMVTFKKMNKRLEIQITQPDPKKNTTNNKNILHQNVVLRFGKEAPLNASGASGLGKPSKFEFNLALSGLGDGSKPIQPETSNVQGTGFELKSAEDENENVEVEGTPRTVWNDATDHGAEEELLPDTETSPSEGEPPCQVDLPGSVEEEKSVTSEEEPPERNVSTNVSNAKTNEDSLRYEKNLEFLQQKTSQRVRDDEEDVAKDKPSAILIQNGQTKLALIRYQ